MPDPSWRNLSKVSKTEPKKEKEPKAIERRKPIAKVGKRKKERIKSDGTETEVFKGIWGRVEHRCEVCKGPVFEAFDSDGNLRKPECFAHRLAKGLYPKHRTNPDNIALVCSFECHHGLDKLYLVPGKRRELEQKLLSQ